MWFYQSDGDEDGGAVRHNLFLPRIGFASAVVAVAASALGRVCICALGVLPGHRGRWQDAVRLALVLSRARGAVGATVGPHRTATRVFPS